MQTQLAPEIREIIKKVPFMPAVSIIAPFNPKMVSSGLLHHQMDDYYAEVSRQIMLQYDDELGMVVLQKLSGVLKRLRYDTMFQSVAIFVSPVYQKVYYLRFPVLPFIQVGEHFSIKNILAQKKGINRLLVLSLFPGDASLYLASAKKIHLIKANTTETARNNYRQLDKELKWILDAYVLPVIAVGSREQLSAFQKITKHSKFIVKYVPMMPESSARPDHLLEVLQCYTGNWEEIRKSFLQKDLGYAKKNAKLEYGFEAITDAIFKHKAHRLYIKKDFLEQYEQNPESFDQTDPCKYYNRFSYIKNDLDDVIAKALESDADVEVVEDDFLEGYRSIALVKK